MLEILDFAPEHQKAFKKINEQWIRRGFVMEDEDIRTLNDPENYILKNGGRIFIALLNGEVVGTVAYLNFGDNVFELIKMAVDENFRGLKIGKKLCEWSLQKMKIAGAKKVFLFSNKGGSAIAIALYKKLGFKETPLGNSEYLRADIRMELDMS